jgi:hypothetical protein
MAAPSMVVLSVMPPELVIKPGPCFTNQVVCFSYDWSVWSNKTNWTSQKHQMDPRDINRTFCGLENALSGWL